MTPTADQRARLAAAQDTAQQATPPTGPDEPDQWPPVTRLTGGDLPPVPEGYAAWCVGPTEPEAGPRNIVVMPLLTPDAPGTVWRRYLARVIATATGACPLCGEAAGIDGPDPEDGHRATYAVQPVRVGLTHTEECPATFTEAERDLFPAFREGEP